MKLLKWIVTAILIVFSHTYATQTMEDLIVETTRLKKPLNLMSSSVDIISKKDLERSGVAFVAEALERLPGIHAARTGGQGQVVSIYMRGAKPQHTLILVDGVRMNGQLDLNGYDLANLDVTNIKRIEVLKGPQSTLYGSDAMAGVINIITQEGPHDEKVYIDFQYGAFNTEKYRAGFSAGGEKLYYSINGTYFHQDGFSSTKAAPDKDGLLNKTFSANVGGSLNNNLKWTYNARKIDATGEYDNGLYIKEQTIQRLGFNQSVNDKISAAGGISYLDLKRNQYDTDYCSDTLSFDLNADLEIHDKLQLFVGIEGHEDKYSQTGYESYEGDLDNHATLAICSFNPFEGSALSLSARKDNHSRFGNASTYQGGFSFTTPIIETRVHGSYGTGFKAPASFNLSLTPSLEPEESKGWEIGIEQPLADRQIIFRGTVFKKDYENFIEYNWNSGDAYYENLTKATSDGFELSSSWEVTKELTWLSTYSYLNNKSDDGFSSRRPMHKVDNSLNYKYNKNLNLNAHASYVGDRVERNVVMDEYLLVNFSVNAKTSENITLYWHIENLLDESYETALDFSWPPIGYNIAGRSFYGGVKINF